MAASSVPSVNICSMAPIVPLAASAAPSRHQQQQQQYRPHPNNPEPHQHQHIQTSAIRMPHRTVAIPNPLLPTPQPAAHVYRQTNGGDYSVLLARPPPPAAPPTAHAQLPTRSYSPEDDLTKKITQRIQEKLKRLNPNIMNEVQLPPMDFPTTQPAFQLDAPPDNRRANNLLVNNAMGVVGHAAGSKSATNRSAAPIVHLTADFEKKTADFEKKSELAVDLIRKRIAESLDRSSPARTDIAIALGKAAIPDTVSPPHTTSYEATKRSITNLNSKFPPKKKKKRKRPVDPPNYDKISRAMDFFIERGIDDEDVRCALREDEANFRMKQESVIDVYKTVIKDVESRLEMYTKLERLAEQIVDIRSARKKQHARERNRGDTSDGQIEADCDMIRLHLKNYRLLEDAMDRIILIDQEKK